MTYQEALDFLNGNFVSFQTAGRTAYKGGLEAITGMCRAMGDPQRDYLSIHIAGTNGKGSVAHMLASVLQAAGYRTGLYTSPHLHDFRERIRVDGEMIPQEKVAAFLDRYGKEMTERGLSYFEMTTAMAFHRFSEAGVEVAVVETGLGGRLDATNVLQPILSIITNIGLDHSDILGPTVAHIAAEKAGIIKPGIPVLVGETDPESAPVFTARAAECGSPLVFADRTYECTGSTLRPPLQYCTLRRIGDGATRTIAIDLLGEYQRKNLVTVRTAVSLLRHRTQLDISRRAMLDGCPERHGHHRAFGPLAGARRDTPDGGGRRAQPPRDDRNRPPAQCRRIRTALYGTRLLGRPKNWTTYCRSCRERRTIFSHRPPRRAPCRPRNSPRKRNGTDCTAKRFRRPRQHSPAPAPSLRRTT